MSLKTQIRRFVRWQPMVFVVPPIIFGLAALAGIGTNTAQHKLFDDFMHKRAINSEANMVSEVTALRKALLRMAQRWSNDSKNYALWKKDANSYIQDFNGIRALSFIDVQEKNSWTVFCEGATDVDKSVTTHVINSKLFQESRNRPVFISQPIIKGEEKLTILTIPVNVDGLDYGHLMATLNLKSLFKSFLSEGVGQGYEIEIFAGKTLVYQSLGKNQLPNTPFRDYSMDADGDGKPWLFRLYPGVGTQAAILGPVPEMILLTGSFIAFLSYLAIQGLRRSYIYTLELSEQVKETKTAQLSLQHMATHDTLTGLPNRESLKAYVGEQVLAAREKQQQFSLLFLDLDHFKDINDTLGHEFGDLILKQIPDRLRMAIEGEACIARMGGDEFIICSQSDTTAFDFSQVSARLLNAIHQPYIINGNELYVSASIGIANFPEDGNNVSELIARADSALHSSKAAGRNTFTQYVEGMATEAEDRIALLRELRSALNNGEFEMWYQPRFDLESNTIVSAEALLRWNNSKGQVITPSQFIQLAEDTGIIVPIGISMTRQALVNFLPLLEDNPQLNLSVNISARQLAHPNVLADLKGLFESTNFPPHRLELELAEQVLVRNLMQNRSVLEELTELGVSIALDDFGTGYSSLAYLKSFPISVIKIDKSFVEELPSNSDDAVIVNTIIGMAKNLGLATVAEGVETQAQSDWLTAQGCDQIQGYLCGRPQPIDDIKKLLAG